MTQISTIQLDGLEDLRHSFARKLPAQIREVVTGWKRAERDPGNDEAVRNVARLLHNLVGSSGTFGFTGVSNAARALREILSTCMEGGIPPGESSKVQIDALLVLMKKASTKPDQGGETSILFRKPAEETECSEEPNKLVFLVEDDKDQAGVLATQVRHFGYDVRTFDRFNSVRRALKESAPAAVIMDIMLPEGKLAGAKGMAEINRNRPAPIPVVFLSVRGDLPARLEAVRAGASAYFTKPADVSRLVDQLDVMTSRRAAEPFRVLTVDDDPAMSGFLSATLRQAGMITLALNKPAQAIEHIREFMPDLILLDVQMPECSGPELAAVLRQQAEFVGIPIVFLSSESDTAKQTEARRIGAEDFLTKPITPARLVSEVSLRAHRSRSLRSHMVRDGQTGLLNHTAIMAHLNHEVARARRQATKLSVAMIDVDRFKAVNDTHGHAAGDAVLKGLTQMLQKRLRKTDSIGRYGGDEIIVILPDTDAAAAEKVMDGIRASFARVRHQTSERFFYATFSCGVADLQKHPDAGLLNEAADKALYIAKRAGGNRVSRC